ncbi:hypothetical protein F5B22DRAFT_152845 [Xylaria bambusicola]|uniref:uncharacterized protein n=1 Tax=Xylaria bambusicola TaxID=326684 RepID=UPI002007E237|nr:uncharacterized protein F5B22DRAFT_152845 [Xylaria bambusicola]KAI0526314.1 hypothetical protein F5B22DRAFT_152845 [Xylaria bambusicola]
MGKAAVTVTVSRISPMLALSYATCPGSPGTTCPRMPSWRSLMEMGLSSRNMVAETDQVNASGTTCEDLVRVGVVVYCLAPMTSAAWTRGVVERPQNGLMT